MKRRIRYALKTGIQCRPHRETATVKTLVAVLVEQFAPDFFNEVIRTGDICARRRTDSDRFPHFNSRRCQGNKAVCCHPVQNVIPPVPRSLRPAHGVVVIGRLRQPCKESRLAQGQLVQ